MTSEAVENEAAEALYLSQLNYRMDRLIATVQPSRAILPSTMVAGYEYVSGVYTRYRANHLSSAGHFRAATDLCHTSPSGYFLCVEPNDEQAISHLRKIPATAPEYDEALKLMSTIELNRQRLKAIHEKQEKAKAAQLAKEEAERNRLMNQSDDESRSQMFRNVRGEAHDAFTCGTSTDNSTVMSFDYGHYWWEEDGRLLHSKQPSRPSRNN